MDFSVVVEGGPRISSEEDQQALERFVRSLRIPPALLDGKQRVLKKNLSYSEALSICDRLAEFGLETAVHPPFKSDPPELRPAAPAMKAQGPAQAKATARKTPAKGVPDGKASTSPRRSSNARKTSPQAAPAKPGSGDPAQEVKGWFTNPAQLKKALSSIPPSRGQRWRYDLAAGALAACLLASYAGFALLGPALLVLTFTALAPYSALAAILICLLLLPPLILLLVLGLRPLLHCLAAPDQLAEQVLSPTTNPRLVLLARGICQLLGIAPPVRLLLNTRPDIRARWDARREELSLQLGSPLVAALRISELAALIAAECNRFADAAQGRGSAKLLQLEARIKQALAAAPPSRGILALAARSRSDGLVRSLRRAARAADAFHRITCLPLRFVERAIERDLEKDDGRYIATLKHFLGDMPDALQGRLRAVRAESRQFQAALQSRCPQAQVQASARTITSPIPERAAVNCHASASQLCGNFAEAERKLRHRLHEAHGLPRSVPPPDEALRTRRAQQEKQLQALAREYFAGWFAAEQFWLLPPPDFARGGQRKVIAGRLNQCIGKIRFLAPDRKRSLTEASRLAAAIRPVKLGVQWLGSPDRQEVVRLESRYQQTLDELKQQNAAMGERIALALALASAQSAANIFPAIHRALFCLGQCAERFQQLIALSEQVGALEKLHVHNPVQRHRRTLGAQALGDELATVQRQLLRKLEDCPLGFIDPRFPTLAGRLTHELEWATCRLGRSSLLERSEMIRAIVSESFEGICQIAAGYASRVEKGWKIQTIRVASGEPGA